MDEDRERDDLAKVALAVEAAILAVIARHLSRIDERTTHADVSAWHAAGMADIAAIAATASSMLSKRAGRAFEAGERSMDSWAETMFEAAGKPFVKVSGNPFAAQSLSAGKAKAVKDLESMMRTSVLRIVAPDGTTRPVAEAYREALAQAVAGVNSLGGSYQESIDRMVRLMARNGVRVQYESGAVRELYAAVSMNVMDNYRMTMQDARNEVGRSFGADGVEVSAHGMCSNDHMPYQGRMFSNEEFARIQRSLGRPIAQGFNCRHQTFPVILGISRPSHTAEQLREYREKSLRKVEINGRTMTAYEFSQRQRSMETSVRKLKAERMVLKAAGTDVRSLDDAIAFHVARYEDESRTAGVRTHPERMAAYEWRD